MKFNGLGLQGRSQVDSLFWFLLTTDYADFTEKKYINYYIKNKAGKRAFAIYYCRSFEVAHDRFTILGFGICDFGLRG